MNIVKRKLPLIVLLTVITILALAPVVQVFLQSKGVWHGVIPEYPNDATFYLSRMAQVGHGYFFIGNPYIWEYRMAPALSFFVADWLAAVPLILGASFTVTVVFGLIFWSILFGIIGYVLFRKLELTAWQSVIATILSHLQIYWLIMRPVAMQTVYPAYLLFLLSFLLWFKVPTSKKRIIFLAVSSAITFYIYTFLWQIVAISFVLTYGYLLIRKRWDTLRALVISNLITAVLALPMFIYMVKQATSPFYWEALVRVNLVYSRLPTLDVYYYGRWVVLAIVLCLIFRLQKSDQPDNNKERTLFAVVGITGLALMIASASNVILNKEVDTASHIGRFITLWFSIIFCTVTVRLWSKIGKDNQVSKFIKIGVVVVLLAVSFGYLRNFSRSMSIFNITQADVISVQDYAPPLNWLDQNTTPEQVVWVLNPKIGTHVSTLTHNYSLFNQNAAFYLMPSTELVERYLVSRYFDDPSATDLERSSALYTGSGWRGQYKAHNRWVEICTAFFLEKFGYECGSVETGKGSQYFAQLRDTYLNQIVPNINKELVKYHVTYLMIDREHDQFKRPLKTIKGLTPVYKDVRFEIYKLVQK